MLLIVGAFISLSFVTSAPLNGTNNSYVLAKILFYKSAKGQIMVANGPVPTTATLAVRDDIVSRINDTRVKIVSFYNDSKQIPKSINIFHLIKSEQKPVYVTEVKKRLTRNIKDWWDNIWGHNRKKIGRIRKKVQVIYNSTSTPDSSKTGKNDADKAKVTKYKKNLEIPNDATKIITGSYIMPQRNWGYARDVMEIKFRFGSVTDEITSDNLIFSETYDGGPNKSASGQTGQDKQNQKKSNGKHDDTKGKDTDGDISINGDTNKNGNSNKNGDDNRTDDINKKGDTNKGSNKNQKISTKWSQEPKLNEFIKVTGTPQEETLNSLEAYDSFIPNDIYYSVEKRCVNWSDVCDVGTGGLLNMSTSNFQYFFKRPKFSINGPRID